MIIFSLLCRCSLVTKKEAEKSFSAYNIVLELEHGGWRAGAPPNVGRTQRLSAGHND
jgi:hypothetical protein